MSYVGYFKQSRSSVPRTRTRPVADLGLHSQEAVWVASPFPILLPSFALCVPGFLTSDLLTFPCSLAITPFALIIPRVWFMEVLDCYRACTSEGGLVLTLPLTLSTQASHDLSRDLELRDQKI